MSGSELSYRDTICMDCDDGLRRAHRLPLESNGGGESGVGRADAIELDVARDTHLRIGFRFTDADEASSVELRHSIIEVSPGLEGDLDAMVTMPKALFGRMLRGETTFSQGIGNGTITVSGDHSRAEELFSCVDFTYPGIRLNGAK